MIESSQGNLLQAGTEALINTVNTVGVMGKGIALQFAKAYPDMRKAYEKACKAGEVVPGRMWLYDCGGLAGGPRWIINFPTKRHWRASSRMEDIESGLINLAAVIRQNHIRSIAIPPLGCGNGGLDWSEVRPKIEATFATLPEVRALVFAPAGTPADASDTVRTEKPKMTPGRAALIALVNRYLDGLLEPMVSLLEIHKLMYFIKVAGEPLERLKFEKNLYGPYSPNLGKTLSQLDGHYTTGYADGDDDPKRIIDLKPGAIDDANAFLAEHPQTHARLDRVSRLIEGFEDAYGMELLATVHWVMNDSPATRDSEPETIRTVQRWSSRKKDLFKPDHIALARKRILEQSWC